MLSEAATEMAQGEEAGDMRQADSYELPAATTWRQTGGVGGQARGSSVLPWHASLPCQGHMRSGTPRTQRTARGTHQRYPPVLHQPPRRLVHCGAHVPRHAHGHHRGLHGVLCDPLERLQG